ncbi:MAG: DUF4388 domain-containing protein [Actinomycetota bacterium]
MLQGTLDDFSLPDMLRLMSYARKTGRLDIKRNAGTGKLYFRDGNVYYAESSLSKEPLGQKLIRAGALTEGQLVKALDRHADTGERVGQILVNAKYVSEEQLQNALRQQIEDSVFDLLRWELGDFSWEPRVEADVEVSLAVSVENLIMEASRRLDELEIIRRKIPSAQAVLRMSAAPPEGAAEINITPPEWRILVLVDGIRTVAAIAAMVGLDEFEAMRTLYGLVSAGLIEVADTGVGPETREAVEAPEVFQPSASRAAAVERLAATEAAKEPERDEVVDVVEPAEVESEVDISAETAPDEAEEIIEPGELEEPARVVVEEAGAESEIDEVVTSASGIASEYLPATDFNEADEFAPIAEAQPAGLAPEFAGEQPQGTGDAEWLAEQGVSSFDAPSEDEVVTETPPEPSFSELIPAPDTELSEPPPPPGAEMLTDQATEEEPQAEPEVDRSAVVRELAGLFSEEQGGGAGGGSSQRGPGEAKHRVEDDDSVDRGLISRLIDGVKGL